jgi:hypothetical protein
MKPRVKTRKGSVGLIGGKMVDEKRVNRGTPHAKHKPPKEGRRAPRRRQQESHPGGERNTEQIIVGKPGEEKLEPNGGNIFFEEKVTGGEKSSLTAATFWRGSVI